MQGYNKKLNYQSKVPSKSVGTASPTKNTNANAIPMSLS